MKRHPKNGGFSLIELSIGLVILGLIMAASMQVYSRYRIQKLIDDTRGHRNLADSALRNYYITNGYYPCPADRTLAPNDPNRGRGLRDPVTNVCTIAAALAPGHCTTNNGICRATGYDADGTGGGDPVYIGALPFQDLKIPFDNTLDGWSRQMAYAVSGSMTVSKAAFNNDHGAITGYTFDPDDYAKGKVTPKLQMNPDIPTKPVEYHYAIISYGQDGYGAFTPDGSLYHACSTEVPLPADAMNCQNTASFQFLDNGQGFASIRNAMHYDDYITAITSVDGEIWSRSGTNGDITSIERIGIGTSDVSLRLDKDGITPAPNKTLDDPKTDDLDEGTYNKDITIDVLGDIGATKVQTYRICDATNENCFSPADIGGKTGVLDCNSSSGGMTGNAMRGIANSSPDCPALPIVPFTGSCKPGQYLTGFSGGKPTCQAF